MYPSATPEYVRVVISERHVSAIRHRRLSAAVARRSRNRPATHRRQRAPRLLLEP